MQLLQSNSANLTLYTYTKVLTLNESHSKKGWNPSANSEKESHLLLNPHWLFCPARTKLNGNQSSYQKPFKSSKLYLLQHLPDSKTPFRPVFYAQVHWAWNFIYFSLEKEISSMSLQKRKEKSESYTPQQMWITLTLVCASWLSFCQTPFWPTSTQLKVP